MIGHAQRYRSIFAAAIVMVGLFAAVIPQQGRAQTSPSWHAVYTGDVLPEEVGFAIGGTGCLHREIHTGGVYHLRTSSGGSCANFGNPLGWNPDPAVGFTAEARVKVISGGSLGVAGISFITASRASEAIVLLSTAGVAEAWSGGRFFMNTTSDFHSYRLVVKNRNYWIYVDNVLRISGTTRSLNRQGIHFGDGSFVSGGDALWDCFAFTSTGAFSPAELPSPTCDAPPPEPVDPILFPIDGTEPGFPVTQYSYATSAITVDPYPPTINEPVTLGVLLQNPTPENVVVSSVTFEVSGFGMGLPWGEVGKLENVIIPAATMLDGESIAGSTHKAIQWTPPFSGHHCVRVTLTFADGRTQVLQRNIDILGFSSGGSDTSIFTVGNPTESTATVELRIVKVATLPDPGWTAALSQTSVLLGAGQKLDVDLTIMPPSGAPDGSYAVFHVEAYIGETLIGGISKTVIVGSGLAAPALASLADGDFVRDRFIVEGTALPLAEITCTTGGGLVFRTITDSAGNWRLFIDLSGSGSGNQTLFITQRVDGRTSEPIGGSGSGGGVEIIIDVDAPTTTIESVSGSGSGFEHWFNGDVTITLSASDGSGVGLGELFYSASGATAIPETVIGADSACRCVPGTAVVITEEGETTISYFAVDMLGNVSAVQTLTVRIDRTAPVISEVSAAPDPFSPNGDGFRDTVDVSYTLDDNLALWGTVTVRIFDEEGMLVRTLVDAAIRSTGALHTEIWDGTDDSGNPVADCTCTYTIDATDVAGNAALQQTGTLVLDTTGPAAVDVLANPNPAQIDTEIALAATVDDMSRVGSVIVSAEYNIDGGAFRAMTPQDGAFDTATEDVTGDLSSYAEPGVHKVCVRGTDIAGNAGPASCILLAVYDPEGGFVTGGGWINSPLGACKLTVECETMTGKANFGFVSKYKKGATIPTGQTEFQFRAGGLNFHSSSYEWLVVSGARAQYKGWGTINGAGEYGFMLTAIDGQLNGGGGSDKFRIKIWDGATGELVYDNQMGDGDTAEPTMVISGGSIMIHQ